MSVRRLLIDESAAASVETCVMLALIIAVCIGAVRFFGGETNQLFSTSNAAIVKGIK